MTNDENKRPVAELNATIAANIRDLRRLKGLTQASLAARVQLDATAVAKIEVRKRNVSADELWAIAVALEVDVNQLYQYPGQQDDRVLLESLLAPERELAARLNGLKHFASAVGDGTLHDAALRIQDGLAKYRKEVPKPLELTGSPELVQRALSDAERMLTNYQSLRHELSEALDNFELSEKGSLRADERTEERATARTVHRRGPTND